MLFKVLTLRQLIRVRIALIPKHVIQNKTHTLWVIRRNIKMRAEESLIMRKNMQTQCHT